MCFYEYIFSLSLSFFFYSTKEIQIGKGEMMFDIKNQACCHLSHTILYCYDYQNFFSLTLPPTGVGDS